MSVSTYGIYEHYNYSDIQPTVGSVVNWNEPLTALLGAYWPLNEGAGLLVKDIVGLHSGILKNVGADNWFPSKNGNSLLFTNQSGIVDCGKRDDILLFNKPLTISAWIFPYSTGGNAAGRILSKSLDVAAPGLNFFIRATNALSFNRAGGVTFTKTSQNNVINLLQWQQVAGVFDGGESPSSCKLYVNGLETTYQTSASGSVPTSNIGNSIYIGNVGDFTRNFDGNITNVKCWNRMLNSNEILYDYCNPWAMIKPVSTFMPLSFQSSSPVVVSGNAAEAYNLLGMAGSFL